jgi:hypothetical protein
MRLRRRLVRELRQTAIALYKERFGEDEGFAELDAVPRRASAAEERNDFLPLALKNGRGMQW